MKYLFLFMFASSLLVGVENKPATPPKLAQIATVKSKQWDAKQVLVKGVIIEKRADDDFLLQDESDEITLFLPTDDLMDLHLQVGMELEVLGTIDYSSVSRDKTELDADKITIKSQPKQQVAKK